MADDQLQGLLHQMAKRLLQRFQLPLAYQHHLHPIRHKQLFPAWQGRKMFAQAFRQRGCVLSRRKPPAGRLAALFEHSGSQRVHPGAAAQRGYGPLRQGGGFVAHRKRNPVSRETSQPGKECSGGGCHRGQDSRTCI